MKKTAKPAAPAASPTPTATPEPEPTTEDLKKNARPAKDTSKIGPGARDFTPSYFYEFDRPGFQPSHVVIEHDTSGAGRISFQKDEFQDTWTDPIDLSAATVSSINDALGRLNFLDSEESYQYEKDYPHLGNIVFTLKRDGRERTVKFNWTTNKDAKSLADIYKAVSNEYIWKFNIAVARENQPLESPRLMEMLDGYVTRGEISDPPHLVPFLTEISNDERLPLIARNHASRLIKRIEGRKK